MGEDLIDGLSSNLDNAKLQALYEQYKSSTAILHHVIEELSQRKSRQGLNKLRELIEGSQSHCNLQIRLNTSLLTMAIAEGDIDLCK